MASQAETTAMRRALVLAAGVDLSRDPNPRVGAVVLTAAGETVAEAAHCGAGTAHAEVAALAAAGSAAFGATVVVTLEPCAHTGRTRPCTAALIASGVHRVVYAQDDPNPEASGGASQLRRAGVDVEGGVLGSEAAQLNSTWSFAVAHGRPFVTWKLAATLDGRSAAEDGTSRWITGAEARADVHRLRAACDVVVAGTGTVAVDNPHLTVRGPDDVPLARELQPLRVVMGMRDLDPASLVFDAAAPTAQLRTRDPAVALAELFSRGRRHVWLEGGPTLGAAFLKAGLVDEVVAYVAAAFLGGGRAAVADLGITTMDDAIRLDVDDVARLGSDVRLTMRGAR